MMSEAASRSVEPTKQRSGVRAARSEGPRAGMMSEAASRSVWSRRSSGAWSERPGPKTESGKMERSGEPKRVQLMKQRAGRAARSEGPRAGMMSEALDVERIVQLATDAAGSDDFGEPTWQDGLDRLTDSLAEEAAAQRARASRSRPASSSTTSPTGWASSTGASEHPEIADGRRRAADRDRRPGPHRHDDPPRPARAGSRPTACRSRGRSTARSRRPRPRPTTPIRASPRSTRPLDGVELVIPGFQAMHPMGARLAAGVRAHHRRATSAA